MDNYLLMMISSSCHLHHQRINPRFLRESYLKLLEYFFAKLMNLIVVDVPITFISRDIIHNFWGSSEAGVFNGNAISMHDG